MKLRGSLTVLESIVIGLLAIAVLGTIAYSQPVVPVIPAPQPSQAPDDKNNRLSLETFYISPNPTIIAVNNQTPQPLSQSLTPQPTKTWSFNDVFNSGQADGWNFDGSTKTFIWSGSSCEPDSAMSNTCTCAPTEETDIFCPSDPNCFANGGFSFGAMCVYDDPTSKGYQDNLKNTSCSIQCNSKPVIYLYPEQPTFVDVRLDIPGQVTVSDPLYPAGGWKHILAHPDGTLLYDSKLYRELYYETATIKAPLPDKGFYIPQTQLREKLTEYTTRLGLNTFEQNEFLDYWIPSLEKLHAPYIFFSVYSPENKDLVDRVTVNPEPDTVIAFLAYFKPVNAIGAAASLTFPEVPARHGFTMVEWGGTIDR